jgi:opacity protein-like surface antigen
MRIVPVLTLALLLVGGVDRALADVTGFIGAATTPEARAVRGAALGMGLLVAGVEFEYAATSEDPGKAPSLKTGMGNGFLQTPFPIFRVQPYFTVGGGLYREELGGQRKTGFGLNTGGGAKVSLAGPLRLRLDYRVFRLGDAALHSPTHRFYAGINLAF